MYFILENNFCEEKWNQIQNTYKYQFKSVFRFSMIWLFQLTFAERYDLTRDWKPTLKTRKSVSKPMVVWRQAMIFSQMQTK